MSLSLPESFSFELRKSRVFIIGIAGGADSGKEEFSKALIEQLQKKSAMIDRSKVLLLHLHDFYKELSDEDRVRASLGDYNFDHPGTTEQAPTKDIAELNLVVLEGIFVLFEKETRDRLNMKLFIDADDDARLVNRVQRKTAEIKPDSVDQILMEYVKFVKPAFDNFVQPSKKWADIIIPHGVKNTTAIKLIVDHASDLLKQKQQINLRLAHLSVTPVLSNAGSNSSSACPSPRFGRSPGNNDSPSRSSLTSSPVPRKDVLGGSNDNQFKPVPE
ncbi:Uridine-cytidine kinase 2 [Entomortierella beljakovae]|nr:Uridine-cytidine kinase 2 [Entomortierella beljakovae]